MNNPSKFKQTTDYNCGPAALAYFLDAVGIIGYNVDYLTRVLGTTDEEGTHPKAIANFIREKGLRCFAGSHILLEDFTLPMIVNYFVEDDGHYAVITDLDFTPAGGMVTYFDPATGHHEQMTWDQFRKNWYSFRYGDHWGLFLEKEGKS
jgi:predicted double-glycine peptidase